MSVNPSVTFKETKKTFTYGAHNVTLSTGKIARQATAAVTVQIGDTIVLVTAVVSRKLMPNCDFLPLTIHYQERAYAAGRIPGGFLKREGRPSERETLICRLIDRPLRPSFPKNFHHEIQVTATLLSLDPQINPDIAALIGASAALVLTGTPFQGPVAAARVGYKNGEYLLNPNKNTLVDSDLDLVVAGTQDAILMVESEANMLSEEVMLGAVMYGHQQMQIAINAITDFAKEAGTTDWGWTAPVADESLQLQVKSLAESRLGDAYLLADKIERNERLNSIRSDIVAQLMIEGATCTQQQIENALHKIEKNLVRSRILAGEKRIDGRANNDIRAISVETGVLPRTHGSALFTRGETQALVIATLGTDRDAQRVDAPEGETLDPFMLHYNFPPYSVGEIGQMGSPKRREIGHGRLARRAIEAVLPKDDKFPYVMRVVSEITESNGSSSMASVCGTSLALMDAGVPLKASVAGIAMGLIKQDTQFAILSDIMGDEDHLGDMDFKVAGTQTGITALQMDIKIAGITEVIMKQALTQAREGRLHILSIMDTAITGGRQAVSAFAPRITTLKIHPEKIKDVIGKGGATIRALTEETGATIDIGQDGTIKIAAVDQAAGELAMQRIKELTQDIEVGQIYDGTVLKLMEFGAIVSLVPGRDGLVHISQICHERVQNVQDKLTEGQKVQVKVIEIDKQGRIRLSMKELLAKENHTQDA